MSQDDGASTVMMTGAQIRAGLQAMGAAPPPPPPPPVRHAEPPPPVFANPEEQKAHDEARKFARLVVSEIKLYNEAKVNEGRRNKDVYERLKEDIERGRQMYNDRVPAHVRDHSRYFVDELVRILGDRKSTRLNSSHIQKSRMPSSA